MEATLKKGALGYKSKEVEAYLVELSSKYERNTKAKDREIEALTSKVEELEKKIEGYEAERLSVADALVKAQKEAQDIMDAAVSEAEKERAKIQADCNAIEKQIADAKATLTNMQKDAMKVMADYEALVQQFTDFSGLSNED